VEEWRGLQKINVDGVEAYGMENFEKVLFFEHLHSPQTVI
jgi:hypothetical protein